MTLEEAKAVLLNESATAEEKATAEALISADAAKTARAELEQLKTDTEALKTETKEALVEASKAKATSALDTKLSESKLPAESCDVVRDVFASTLAKGEAPSDEDVEKEVARQRSILGSRPGVGGGGSVEIGAGPQDKWGLGLERMLLARGNERVLKRFADASPTAKGELLASREQKAGIGLSDRAYSFHRTFRACTGIDFEDLLMARGAQKRSLLASLTTTSWGDVFENTLNLAGYAYQEDPDFSDWRRVANIVPIRGTLVQERVVTFGYANLPSVAQGANYSAATSPGDHGQSYTVLKYGYTEDWTREMMLDDRVDALATIVQKMALAADRTKYEYVFDKLTIAGMITQDYDSIATFHASSRTVNNLGTSALDASAIANSRLTMRKQPDVTNSKRLGIVPDFLIIPVDLEESAAGLLQSKAEEPSGATGERTFIRRMNLQTIVVRHWTNTGDWVLAAGPNNGLVPTFEMGFQGGREMADIHVQDMANVGSVFERDAVTVAIKQDYFGGNPIRHEGFYINDVA